MITTSEVAVSVTIDDLANLDGIVKELEQYATVEVDQNQTIICVVGDFRQSGKGYASTVFNALKNIPIRMISHGGSHNNISVLIGSESKQKALEDLNKGVFNL